MVITDRYKVGQAVKPQKRRTNMKKILSLILTAALAGVTLTACSSSGTSSTASSNDASSADTSSAASSAAESSGESTADTDNVIKIGATSYTARRDP